MLPDHQSVGRYSLDINWVCFLCASGSELRVKSPTDRSLHIPPRGGVTVQDVPPTCNSLPVATAACTKVLARPERCRRGARPTTRESHRHRPPHPPTAACQTFPWSPNPFKPKGAGARWKRETGDPLPGVLPATLLMCPARNHEVPGLRRPHAPGYLLSTMVIHATDTCANTVYAMTTQST